MIITKHLNKDLKQKRTEIVSRFHLSHTLQCLLLMGLRTKQELKKKVFLIPTSYQQIKFEQKKKISEPAKHDRVESLGLC